MKIVNDRLAVKASLREPNHNGYLLLAGEVGRWRGLFPVATRTTKRIATQLSTLAAGLTARDDVEEATVFRAVLRAPGEGSEILDQRGRRHARYDIVVLIRTTSPDSAGGLRDDPGYQKLAETLRREARHTHQIVARNAARIDDVDPTQDHAFLFNYFYADDNDVLLDVWEYTAGWFQTKTDLPNSILMRPLDGEPADYGIINYASWPGLRTFLPSLVFRPSFRSFVLANFKANGVAAQPIIYRRT
ncbi:hypothetical protein SAMN05421810_101910 [Amycolatopsis arida]|uniref:Uncharacterized protein n=1 Tax=Amycolatopsis arida TaxID=587909 RepID=A0A1I5MHZ9_9PSEU|nr:hypothetical protein [Amycolatopsis arida]TDX94084.1 hypothetical protein CLV69_104542 [Amycolatopsis arida]SFP08571.1 hypothetical protein SAMN05421810_101910 [Amycolatopsis arida]